MDIILPKVYHTYVTEAVYTLKHMQASKDDYTRIDDQGSELTNEQRYEFLRRIRDGLAESLAEHSKVCTNPTTCGQSLASEKAINSMDKRMSDLEPLPQPQPQQLISISAETVNRANEHTTARQVMAIHYLLKLVNLPDVDKTEIARFIHFMTGKNEKNIYDLVRDPLTTKRANLREEDLKYVRKWFDKLKLRGAITLIDNDLDVL